MRRRRATLVLVTIAGAAVVALWARSMWPGPIEHVSTLPFASGLPLIKQGRLIWGDFEGRTTFLICARDVGGGEVRVLGRQPGVTAWPQIAAVTDSHIYFLETNRYTATIKLSPEELAELAVKPERRAFVITHHTTNISADVAALRSGMLPDGNRLVSTYSGILRRIPLTGGQPEVVRTDIVNFIIAGDTLYWMEPPLGADWTPEDRKHGPQYPEYGRSRVMAAPLGRPARLVFEDKSNRVGLEPASGSDIYLRVSEGVDPDQGSLRRLYPDGRLDPPIPMFNMRDSPPLESGGRLYWVHDVAGVGEGEEGGPAGYEGDIRTRQVVSCRADGSDCRVHAEWAPERLSSGTPVSSDAGAISVAASGPRPAIMRGGDRLYVALSDSALKQSRSDKTKRPFTLYRFHPDRSEALEPILTLPYAGFRLDGDSLYYNETRERDNWFAWSGEGLAIKTSNELYRVRLPH